MALSRDREREIWRERGKMERERRRERGGEREG